MANIQGGSSSANLANVDANYNLQVRTPTTQDQAGFVQQSSEVDAGTITGSRLVRAMELTKDFRLRVGLDRPLFQENFVGTAINSALFGLPVSTMTATVAAGFLTLNAGSSVASGAVARATSWQMFSLFNSYPLYFECLAQFPFLPVANNVSEWGLLLATGTAAPTDGVFFRLNASGEFRAVINSNGVEIQSGTLDFSALVANNETRKFTIGIHDRQADFWINDVLVAQLNLATAGANIINSFAAPITFRCYNSGVTASAQQIKVSSVNVHQGDSDSNKPWQATMAKMGRIASQGQTTQTMGGTAQFANNANPTAAAPTNTTAALGSGLGGIFLANINGLAVTTDFIISSYQVPVATAVVPGKTLHITGVGFSAISMGAANGATITAWAVALNYGHSVVSLATAENAATPAKAPRRIPLGVQTLVASAAVGSAANPSIFVPFNTPVVVNPGEFVATSIRFAQNGSAASQALWCYVTIDGYWE